mmetsp:Transcript_19721/g.57389  ORF Transcript_19721/g.57389 Transcript_19721/m.57389 type:complete len:275 (-) Transcript_19721:45-869(-)
MKQRFASKRRSAKASLKISANDCSGNIFLMPVTDIESCKNSMQPELELVTSTSISFNHNGNFASLKTALNCLMTCDAKSSCRKSSPPLTTTAFSAHDLKWPYGDALWILSFRLAHDVPQIVARLLAAFSRCCLEGQLAHTAGRNASPASSTSSQASAWGQREQRVCARIDGASTGRGPGNIASQSSGVTPMSRLHNGCTAGSFAEGLHVGVLDIAFNSATKQFASRRSKGASAVSAPKLLPRRRNGNALALPSAFRESGESGPSWGSSSRSAVS